MAELFGFEIKRSKKDQDAVTPISSASVVAPTDEDGDGYVASGVHYGQFQNLYSDLDIKDNADLIRKYRTNAAHPEVDMAIEEIVNEAVVVPQDDENIVELDLDSVEISAPIKKKIHVEFQNVLNMLTFNERAHDIFRSWYVDGRLYHHLIVDKDNLKKGIREIRYIDSTKIRKVKQVKKKLDPESGVALVNKIEEYFVYSESAGAPKKGVQIQQDTKNNAVRLANDSVSYVTSGLLDETKSKIVSHLHKAMRPINQLRMMEDSLIVYRLVRAPERRIFYIDTGMMTGQQAQAHITKTASQYRNKLVYDQTTGELKDQRKHMAMTDDFWLPRSPEGRGTEVTTLPGGQNLGEIDDVKYFQRKVYQALNVPVSRLEQEQAFSLGRATEINREEIKFQKFISRLRLRFSKLFLGVLRQQLVLKGIITDSDWINLFHNRVRVEFYKDNHYTELKDAEVMRERLNLMDQASQYVGDYLSKEWVMKNVFRFTIEERDEMNQQIEAEIKSGEMPEDDEEDNS
jgi:hypothetical protein